MTDKKVNINRQSINVQLLEPLIQGLKVAYIREIQIDDKHSAIDIYLDNKDKNRIHLLIEPTMPDNDGQIKLIVHVGSYYI